MYEKVENVMKVEKDFILMRSHKCFSTFES